MQWMRYCYLIWKSNWKLDYQLLITVYCFEFQINLFIKIWLRTCFKDVDNNRPLVTGGYRASYFVASKKPLASYQRYEAKRLMKSDDMMKSHSTRIISFRFFLLIIYNRNIHWMHGHTNVSKSTLVRSAIIV